VDDRIYAYERRRKRVAPREIANNKLGPSWKRASLRVSEAACGVPACLKSADHGATK